MKILVIIEANDSRRFLISLDRENDICELKELVSQKRNSQAIMAALIRGRFEGEVFTGAPEESDAQLILSESGARWDLAR